MVRSFHNDQNHKTKGKSSNDIDRPWVFKGIDQKHDNNNVKKKVEVNISIVNACKVDHFVRSLVVKDEHYITQKDKSQEITYNYWHFFSKVESIQGKIETHHSETE